MHKKKENGCTPVMVRKSRAQIDQVKLFRTGTIEKNDNGNPDSKDCAYWWEGYGGGWWDTACTVGNDPEFNYVCEKGTTLCPNEFDTYNCG